jgi:predicted GNAT family N-acyltransferase
MTIIRILKYTKGQEEEISKFVRYVYDEFVAYDYKKEGNHLFYEWIKPENIAKRQHENKSILLAMNGNIITGMIEIRDNTHISLLFVDKEYQRKGISRKLLDKSIANCLKHDQHLKKFTVHASPYSIPAYERLGFNATSEMQEFNGIKYLPMELKFGE